MANWQPLQMPGSHAADFFFGRMDNERDRRRQSEQDALQRQQQDALTKRQKQADKQAAYLKARELLKAGDRDGARALLAPFVQDMELAQEGSPPSPGGPPAPPAQPTRPPETRALPEGNDYDGFDLGYGDKPTTNIPEGIRQQSTERNEALMNHYKPRSVLRFRDDTGQQYTMDPEGDQERMLAARMQRLDSAFGQGDPEAQELYRDMRPALAAFDDVQPGQVFQTIRDDKRARAQETAAKSRAEAALEAEKRDAELKREGWREAEKRARIMGANRQVITPGQAADNTRADVTAYGAERARWEKESNADQLTDASVKFGEMAAAVADYRKTGDNVALRNALYQGARYITGPGVLTKNEYDETVRNTAGAFASLRSKVLRNWDGSYDDAEVAAMEKFTKNANQALRRRAINTVKNYDQRFRGSYFDQTSPGEVERGRNALLQRFGLTEYDLGGKPKKVRPAEGQRAQNRTRGNRLVGGGSDALDRFLEGLD